MSVGKTSGNNSGYSLFELLVVMIIIGLTTAMVVPYLAGTLGKASLKTAAKSVAASLRYARSSAASEQTAYLALFDFEKRSLRIASEKEKPEDAKEYRLPEGVHIEEARSGSAKEVTESGLFRMTFFPSGASSGGEIILSDDRGKRYAVRVHFITGIVEVGD